MTREDIKEKRHDYYEKLEDLYQKDQALLLLETLVKVADSIEIQEPTYHHSSQMVSIHSPKSIDFLLNSIPAENSLSSVLSGRLSHPEEGESEHYYFDIRHCMIHPNTLLEISVHYLQDTNVVEFWTYRSEKPIKIFANDQDFVLCADNEKLLYSQHNGDYEQYSGQSLVDVIGVYSIEDMIQALEVGFDIETNRKQDNKQYQKTETK